MIGFLVLGDVELLLLGGGCAACEMSFEHTKPIKRREVIKQLLRKRQ